MLQIKKRLDLKFGKVKGFDGCVSLVCSTPSGEGGESKVQLIWDVSSTPEPTPHSNKNEDTCQMILPESRNRICVCQVNLYVSMILHWKNIT